MEELIESEKFIKKPDVEPREFVDYFNLEYGLYQFNENAADIQGAFKEEDFNFIGFFISNSGQERMYFSVDGKPDLFAIAVPLANGEAMLSMTGESYVGLEELSFNE